LPELRLRKGVIFVKFGIHNPSWLFGPDPAEAFEAAKTKAQWAENHGFVWFSVMDHLIQIGGVGAPDEPFMEGWTVLSALAAVTSRIRLATLARRSVTAIPLIWQRSPPAST
jgi:alkanesulfonate monooxygenase SsuD/methylene tetrahydromethanopterin reductase-like flavin-dependent oxidoreductase (luciferase family)